MPFPAFLKQPKTVSVIGAPMIYGQPRPGTDYGPAMLREAGCVPLLQCRCSTLFSPASSPFQTCHPFVHATPSRNFQGRCPDHTRLPGTVDGPSYPCCPGILPNSLGLLHKRIGILPTHVRSGCVMMAMLVATRTSTCLLSQAALSRFLLCKTPGFAILWESNKLLSPLPGWLRSSRNFCGR